MRETRFEDRPVDEGGRETEEGKQESEQGCLLRRIWPNGRRSEQQEAEDRPRA